mgnify:CR=1 FL=1
MKKLVYIVLCMFVSGIFFDVAVADESALLKAARTSYVTVLPFYQKLGTCTPYKLNYGSTYQIFGRSGNSCHFKVNMNDCYMPDSVVKEYSRKSIHMVNQKIRGIDAGYYTFSTGDEHAVYEEKLQKIYCKLTY